MDEATLKNKLERLTALNQKKAEEREAKLESMLAPYKASAPSPGILEQIQFRHDIFYGRTFAVVTPSPEELFGAIAPLLANQVAVVRCHLGISKLNAYDGDQYSKRIGRVVSAAKLQEVELVLKGVHIGIECSTFAASLGKVDFTFMLSHGRVRPFLLDVYDTSGKGVSYAEKLKQIRARKRSK